MKKIAILACYGIRNYGSVLQAFATQQIIDRLGYDNECICYQRKDGPRQYLRIFNGPLLQAKTKAVAKQLAARLRVRTLGRDLAVREAAYSRFVQEHFRFSKIYTGYTELKTAVGNYRAFLVGSDQVWNPVNFGTHYFTMEFVSDGIPKIAYAPSFGVPRIPWYQIKGTQTYLRRIEYLSVREEQGRKIIAGLTDRQVPVVVDPTLLLTSENWDELIPLARVVEGPYIFCYFLGRNPLHRRFAENLKKETGFPIVVLRHLDEIIPSDEAFGDQAPYAVGPAEFVNLIRHAAFVCTDSFHGTLFSILYQKLFFTFKRYASDSSDSTNSRIDSLLGRLQLTERLLSGNESTKDFLKKPINYTPVKERLLQFRQESLNFLKNSLEAATGGAVND